MVARPACESEIADWDTRIQANPDGGSVYQGSVLAAQKARRGWHVRYIVTSVAAVTVWERRIPGLGALWYAPKGPGVTDPDTLARCLDELGPFAREAGVFLLKIEPEIVESPETVAAMARWGHPAPAIQPNAHTVLLPIHADPEEGFAALPKRLRNRIRRARQDGLVVERVPVTEEAGGIMLDLMREALVRRRLMMRDDPYYRAFWREYAAAGQGRMYIARAPDGTPLAGAFVLTFGTKALYKDGGSIAHKVIQGASQTLQWEIVSDLAGDGFTVYDLCGCPPSSRIHDPTHPHYGVGQFKLGFGAPATDYVGLTDIPIRPRAAALWRRGGERFVQALYRRFTRVQYFY